MELNGKEEGPIGREDDLIPVHLLSLDLRRKIVERWRQFNGRRVAVARDKANPAGPTGARVSSRCGDSASLQVRKQRLSLAQ
jgi:hypothetical protein